MWKKGIETIVKNGRKVNGKTKSWTMGYGKGIQHNATQLQYEMMRFYGTKYNRVYAWGINANGNLGLNKTTKEVPETVLPIALNPKAFDNKKVIKVVSGVYSEHAFAITEDGSLYGWGNNMNYQLGLGDVENALGPMKIDIPPVIEVAGGSTYSAAITKDGDVYTWGTNSQPMAFWQAKGPGPLGVKQTAVLKKPRRLRHFTDATPVQLACGKRHMAVVTSNHEVYLWGTGTWGRLGNGSNQGSAEPWLLDHDFESDVMQVACGAKHTHFLTSDNAVFSCGKNENKQLGTEESTAGLAGGNNFDMSSVPAPLDLPSNVRARYRENPDNLDEVPEIFLGKVQASSRWGAAIIVNGEGELLRWGSPQSAPMVMDLPSSVKDFAIGRNHGVYVSPDHELFNLGRPSNNTLNLTPSATALPMKGSILGLAAGHNMSFALVEHDSEEQTLIDRSQYK